MAKIGTAHVEIKPVLDEAAMEAVCQRIADAVTEGVMRGMAAANRPARPLKKWTAGPFGREEG